MSVKTLADLGKDKPIIAALLIVTMMSAYGYYQYTISDPCVVGTAASGK
ncbi:hypothetical protein RS130_14180 [Paraglaciecola aquimarina]|uniref:Uncharacterized protein n=1 Tax=Paraglaciecola aquimarina TaxID=1235557 RepID=A0ABU3SY29_9ALTE|nr:hypothetical protein [Paraglaciecola aquimarina]MDU0354903.1 hypothetical protein [Paraglaciecola aquimarina]